MNPRFASLIELGQFTLRTAVLATLLLGSVRTAQASTAHAPKPASTDKDAEGIELSLKLNLGTIELHTLEPTRRRTAVMSFDLHLTLDPHIDPKMLEQLERWHHRLREQVIVAVRATDIYDFLDPDLKRFRRQILYRINRLLGEPIVTDVLFANFTFSSQ